MPVEPRRPMHPDSEPRIEVWIPDILKRYLERSCIEDLPGVCRWANLPRTIDLGSYAEKARTCLRETENDPQHRERGGALQWEPGRRKVMQTRDERLHIGSESQVVIPLQEYQASHTGDTVRRDVLEDLQTGRDSVNYFKYVSGEISFEEMLQLDERRRRRQVVTRGIGLIHSHPSSSSFSELDVASFLSDDDYKLSVVASRGGEVRALLSCRETEWLPHDRNPRGREKARDEKIAKWKEIIDRKVAKILEDPVQRICARDEIYLQRLINHVADTLYAHASLNYLFGFYKGDEHSVTRVFPE